MQKLEPSFVNCRDSGVEEEYWKFVVLAVKGGAEEQLTEERQLIEENMLHRTLGEINRAISRVVEKTKSQPGSIDEYLFMNSQILRELLNSSSGK